MSTGIIALLATTPVSLATPHPSASTVVPTSSVVPAMGAPPELFALPVGAEMTGYRDTHAFTAKRLSTRPAAFLLSQFLTEVECAAVVEEATASGALHEAATNGRTSARKHCEITTIGMDSPMVRSITNEAARLLLTNEATSRPGSGCEDLHVLRYRPGGEYKPHYDASPSLPRALTILYYVNGEGATWFPFADEDSFDGGRAFDSRDAMTAHVAGLDPSSDGLRVEPTAPGDALAFYNFDASGAPDPYTLHAGLEVDEGRIKWIGAHFFIVPPYSLSREEGQ